MKTSHCELFRGAAAKAFVIKSRKYALGPRN
jgi:hypothetical protein